MNTRILGLVGLVVLGLFLMVLPDLMQRTHIWPEVVRDVGLAVFLASAVAILDQNLQKWIPQARSLKQRFGLVDIAGRRSEMESEITAALRKASKVKISATCLAGFVASHKEQLKENLEQRRGARSNAGAIRISVLHPDSPGLADRAILDRLEKFDPVADVQLGRWRSSIRELEELAAEYKGCLEIQLAFLPPAGSMFILDDALYLTPYLGGQRGALAPCYKYTKAGEHSIYEEYERSFDAVWAFQDTVAPPGPATQDQDE